MEAKAHAHAGSRDLNRRPCGMRGVGIMRPLAVGLLDELGYFLFCAYGFDENDLGRLERYMRSGIQRPSDSFRFVY